MSMIGIEVGKVMPGFKPGLPERVQFDFGKSGGQLVLAYDSPTMAEINEARNGNMKLGLSNIGGILFVLAKFGNEEWMVTPYHYAFSQPYNLSVLLDRFIGYALTVIMFDNVTGIVKALRLVAMPYEMSLLFNRIVGMQKEFVCGGFKVDSATYDTNLASVFGTYSTSEIVDQGETFDLEHDKKDLKKRTERRD